MTLFGPTFFAGIRICNFSGFFSLVLFIAVVATFVYRRLKQERSKQSGGSRGRGGGGGGGGGGGAARQDDDLLVAINSSTPRVTRWVVGHLLLIYFDFKHYQAGSTSTLQ